MLRVQFVHRLHTNIKIVWASHVRLDDALVQDKLLRRLYLTPWILKLEGAKLDALQYMAFGDASSHKPKENTT